MKFRSLRADEIKVRVERVTSKGAVLLLYKDARVDMDILDDTVGPENWQRKHYERKGNMFCSVGINVNFSDKNAPPEWVWKDDAGTESYTAKEKGESSDSFKRACVNWGIGRELYSAPHIFVYCQTEGKKEGKGYVLKDKYCLDGAYVSQVKTEDGVIKELAVVDKKGNVIYTNAGKSIKPVDPSEPTGEPEKIDEKISLIQKEALEKRSREMRIAPLKLCAIYKIKNLSEMTVAQWVDCNSQLAKMEKKREREKKGAKE